MVQPRKVDPSLGPPVPYSPMPTENLGGVLERSRR